MCYDSANGKLDHPAIAPRCCRPSPINAATWQTKKLARKKGVAHWMPLSALGRHEVHPGGAHLGGG